MDPDEQQSSRAREIILRSDLPSLAGMMQRLQRGEDVADASDDVRDAALALGWVHGDRLALTELGWFAADSCREYRFWTDRNRKLPFAGEMPELATEALAGKSILEIGSGSGVNLMSLSGTARELIGLEPVGAYREIGAIMAESEGLAGIQMLGGSAEAIPFPDARFDVVLCVTSHQYFDIVPAFQEIARVLKPGGELIVIGGTLDRYVRNQFRRAVSGSLSNLKNYLVTIINTLSYMTLRKRLLVARNKFSTAYPVYPSRASISRFMAETGLVIHQPLRSVGPETCFRARKPG